MRQAGSPCLPGVPLPHTFIAKILEAKDLAKWHASKYLFKELWAKIFKLMTYRPWRRHVIHSPFSVAPPGCTCDPFRPRRLLGGRNPCKPRVEMVP